MTATITATAHQGETLDALLWRVLGSTSALEQTLLLNRDLADLGPILPHGHIVTIPNQTLGSTTSAPPEYKIINLWD